MVVLATCKNEEDPIKNKGTIVLTSLYIDFSDAQGQLTPQLVVKPLRNSNSSKFSWLSSLTARMEKIQSTSSPKGNDRSPENKQVFLNSSLVSKRFFSIGQGQPTLQSMDDQILNSIKGCYSVANFEKKLTL